MKKAVDVVIASANTDKIKEMQEILPAAGPIRFRSMLEAGFAGDIHENGATFEENALIKARSVHAEVGGYVLADDSGLAVDLLDGAPGIYSARFAGEKAGYPEKIASLQKMLSPWPPEQWQASFICVIALIRPDGSEIITRGECRGRIAPESRGRGGFGYDPVFFIPEQNRTMAELLPQEKHRISHRGQALRKMATLLLKEISPKGIRLTESELTNRFSQEENLQILVFSDSHTRSDFMVRCVARYPDTDLVLHLGDHCASLDELALTLGKPLVGVAGNCDGWLGLKLPGQLLLTLSGKRVFLTHGHAFGVKQQQRDLLKFAASKPIQADAVLFGHTHQSVDRLLDWHGRPVLLLNPGSAHGSTYAPASAMMLRIDATGFKQTLLLDESAKPVL
jgi:XTP/dITP diphosphohydrolase